VPPFKFGYNAGMLIFSRKFLPLFLCQFFSAFNDNFLKTALVFLILFGASDSTALITLASAVFIAPYFFLSGLGGELADRHDKARVAQWLKFSEIAIAGVGVAGFLVHSIPVLFVALAGFGAIAALFGPIKYGILPDHLARERLPAANALIEGATFIAILTGTIAGGLSANRTGDHAIVAVLLTAMALACWVSALFIPPTGSGAPDLKVRANVAASTGAMLRYLRADPRLWWGALVTSWFWLVGIVVLSLLPPLIKLQVGGDEATVTAYLVIFSVAVGVGSALAALIARGRIVLETTLTGAVLLGVLALDLALVLVLFETPAELRGPAETLADPLGLSVAIDLFGLAVAGGLYIVPVFAAVQAWSGVAFRARTIAAVNVLNAAFMTGATVVVAMLQHFGATLPMLFAGMGVLGLGVACAIWKTMPKP
jgi:acyl-[acyl-carrier-protein]-phospholipid O-acyltransferase/long-chain-fatty-acid--[acyl-carrier-protein] ligase